MKRITLIFATALLECSSLFAAQPKDPPPFPFTYNFVTINYPHSAYDAALGINDLGYIVGYQSFDDPKGYILAPSAACPPKCAFKPENYPGSIRTEVAGINNDNKFNSNFETVGSWVDKIGNQHGFMHNASGWTDVDYPGTTGNALSGLNDNNVAAGYYTDGVGFSHPYIYSQPGNQYTPLTIPGSNNAFPTGINDDGVIVGTYVDNQGDHGFEINGSTFTALNYPGATATLATGINNLSAIVGYFQDSEGHLHGFIYYGGTWEQIDDPDSVGGTIVYGINDSFDIVGLVFVSNGVGFAFEATPQ